MPKIRTLSATTAVGWIVQGGWAAGIEEEVAVVRLMVGGRAAIVLVIAFGKLVLPRWLRSRVKMHARTRERGRAENQHNTGHFDWFYARTFVQLSKNNAPEAPSEIDIFVYTARIVQSSKH